MLSLPVSLLSINAAGPGYCVMLHAIEHIRFVILQVCKLHCRGGSPSEGEVQQKKQKLISILKQHDVTVKESSNTHLWQYYPPFAPNWLRLQEVLLPIEIDTADTDADGASG